MHSKYHALLGSASKLHVPKSKPIISFSPVVLSVPNRPVPLELRVTAPATGANIPIILLTHGQGRSLSLSSLEGYAPLAEFYAAHGFCVMQPTHLSSRFLGLQAPIGKELWWVERAGDMSSILDGLGKIEDEVPTLKGRLDKERAAVVGHSAGAWTASMLLGAGNTDPRDGSSLQKPEDRIKAGVVLAGLGNGGSDLSDNGKRMIPFYGGDFSSMSTPALVVCGDEDVSPHLTTRGPDWHADPYTFAPGPKDLLTLKGGKHGLGGISGWDAKENSDQETPEMLGIVQRMSWAYLWSQFYNDEEVWEEICGAFEGLGMGSVESKKMILNF